MEDKLQPLRQPLVTATGIILGFVLNFAATFVKADAAYGELLAYVVGGCLLIGIVSLIITLYRILTLRYDRQAVDAYYQHTVRLFILGVSFAFFGVLLDMFINFLQD